MAGNGELFQAFGMLNQGLTDLATFSAVNKANDQVSLLRNQQMEETERQQSLHAIANNLTMSLVGAGAPASTAQVASESVMGPKPPTIQTAEGALFMGNPKQQKAALDFEEREFQRKRALQSEKLDLEYEKMGYKDSDKIDKAYIDDMKNFEGKTAKKELSALGEIAKLRAFGSLEGNAALETAKRVVLKLGGEDRISDADVRGLSLDPSYQGTLLRKAKLYATGKTTVSDRKELLLIGKVLENAVRRRVNEQIDNYSTGRNGLRGVEGTKLRERLYKTHVGQVPGAAAAGGAPGAAQGSWQRRTLKDGRPVLARELPDGTYETQELPAETR